MAVDGTIMSLRRMTEDEVSQNDLIKAAFIMSKIFLLTLLKNLIDSIVLDGHQLEMMIILRQLKYSISFNSIDAP